MKREYELYGAEIERYIATLTGKKPGSSAGESSKEKTRGALSAFVKILLKNGRSWPDKSDYAEYAEGKPLSQATRQNEARVRNFFAWLEKRRENDTPMEEYVQQDLFGDETLGAIEETSQCVDDTASTENTQANEAEMTAPNEPESLPEPVKARKSRAKGEKKVPVSVYLDGETYRIMNVLSGLTHRSIGEIAASTLSEFAKKNAAKVDAKAEEVQAALDAVKKAMENFTLEY